MEVSINSLVLLQYRLFGLRSGWFARCLDPGALLVSARPPRRLATPAMAMSGLASKALTLSRSCSVLASKVRFLGNLGDRSDFRAARRRIKLILPRSRPTGGLEPTLPRSYRPPDWDRVGTPTTDDGTNYRARYCSHAERRLPELECYALVSHC